MQKNSIVSLSNLAVPLISKGRFFKENKTHLRSDFQRDRDRIIHSTAFRRLKHKTQVFVNTTGDHFRTRITHSLEVAQIARTLSKFFSLNEDLCETLSLAHDLGHTPFGHAGEEALNDCMKRFGGFDHNIQTLRTILFLENRYYAFKGLNLTLETLDGLIKHNGPIKNLKKFKEILGVNYFKNKINFSESPSLEAQVASISDDIAYNSHDLGDGLRAGFFNLSDIKSLPIIDEAYEFIDKKYKAVNYKTKCHEVIRHFLNKLVTGLIDESSKRLKLVQAKNFYNCKNQELKLIDFSKKTNDEMKIISKFLLDNMYRNKVVLFEKEKCSLVVKELFDIFNDDPNLLPKEWQEKIDSEVLENPKRIIGDYISGMTDRFAINLHKQLVKKF